MSAALERAPTSAHAQTLGDFAAELSRRHGTKPALIIKPGVRDRITTYAGLDQLASRVARLLQLRKISPGDRVLLWAPNMPEWVGVFLGCHKAGVVVVPL